MSQNFNSLEPPEWESSHGRNPMGEGEFVPAKVLYAEIVREGGGEAHGVPTRFGLLALLSLMAVFSVVFGVLRIVEALAPLYLFLGCMAAVSGLAQMRFGNVPRAASIISGAIFLPVFWIGAAGVEAYYQGQSGLRTSVAEQFVLGTPCMAVGGGFVGYLIGVVVAGVFLLASMWEERSRRP